MEDAKTSLGEYFDEKKICFPSPGSKSTKINFVEFFKASGFNFVAIFYQSFSLLPFKVGLGPEYCIYCVELDLNGPDMEM